MIFSSQRSCKNSTESFYALFPQLATMMMNYITIMLYFIFKISLIIDLLIYSYSLYFDSHELLLKRLHLSIFILGKRMNFKKEKIV